MPLPASCWTLSPSIFTPDSPAYGPPPPCQCGEIDLASTMSTNSPPGTTFSQAGRVDGWLFVQLFHIVGQLVTAPMRRTRKRPGTQEIHNAYQGRHRGNAPFSISGITRDTKQRTQRHEGGSYTASRQRNDLTAGSNGSNNNNRTSTATTTSKCARAHKPPGRFRELHRFRLSLRRAAA